MAQHGYLHDTYDSNDFGRGEDRDDQRERSWREGRERGDWRERDRHRDRGMMFNDRDRDDRSSWGSRESYGRGRDEDRDEGRGFFERMGDEIGSWFESDERQEHGRGRSEWRERDRGEQHSNFGREGGMRSYGADCRGSSHSRSYSSHPDDHYRSWRDKQMQQLDSDYRDYCREREQQFHSDFDTWRQNRQSQGQQSGMQSASAGGGSDELMLNRQAQGSTTDAPQEPMMTVDTDSAATLGTTPETGGRNRK